MLLNVSLKNKLMTETLYIKFQFFISHLVENYCIMKYSQGDVKL